MKLIDNISNTLYKKLERIRNSKAKFKERIKNDKKVKYTCEGWMSIRSSLPDFSSAYLAKLDREYKETLEQIKALESFKGASYRDFLEHVKHYRSLSKQGLDHYDIHRELVG